MSRGPVANPATRWNAPGDQPLTGSDRETLAALGPTRVDYGTTALGTHAHEESVRPLATRLGGLIGTFHGIHLESKDHSASACPGLPQACYGTFLHRCPARMNDVRRQSFAKKLSIRAKTTWVCQWIWPILCHRSGTGAVPCDAVRPYRASIRAASRSLLPGSAEIVDNSVGGGRIRFRRPTARHRISFTASAGKRQCASPPVDPIFC